MSDTTAAAPKSKGKPAKSGDAPKCKITRAQFAKSAPKFLTVTVTDDKGQTVGTLVAASKDFETGSVGYYANGQIMLTVDGEACKVQVGANLTLVGSKELPK